MCLLDSVMCMITLDTSVQNLIDDGIAGIVDGYSCQMPEVEALLYIAGRGSTVPQCKTVQVVSKDTCFGNYAATQLGEFCTTPGASYGDTGGPATFEYMSANILVGLIDVTLGQSTSDPNGYIATAGREAFIKGITGRSCTNIATNCN